MNKIIVTPEIKAAMKLINDTDKNVIISGRAGTGKSSFLDYFLENIGDKKVAVLAPTGIAAVNIDGQTIHRFFNLDMRVQDVYDDIYYDRILNRIGNVLKEIDFVVIDEISMVRADIFDSIQHLLNRVRKNIRLIVLGDFRQLAPVIRRDDKDYFYNKLKYRGVYFYQSKRFNLDSWEKVEFATIFRQKDPVLKKNLNIIRDCTSELPEAIEYFNKRLCDKNEDGVMICTRVKQVESVNKRKLDRLDAKPVTLRAKITGNFPKSHYPTDKELILKVGAKVMCTKNHKEGDYVNGTMGTVKNISKDSVLIKSDEGEDIIVCKETWKNKEHVFDDYGVFKSVEIGKFEQYPLKIAYALTVHKAQGKTFNKIIVDKGAGFFEKGQLYVALSRCTSYEGITLKRKLAISDVKM